MEKAITVVGMDTSKASIQPALLKPGDETPLVWEIANDASAVRRMVKKIQREATGEVVFVYEAGPCGYALQRQIESLGSRCMVVAPSLVPVKPGERIKTNRRDAKKLALLYRAGVLTEVRAPSEAEESVRDLVRGREDVLEDYLRCRQRLSSFLLRRGYVYTLGNRWTRGHRRWLKELPFENEADRAVFNDYLLAVEQLEARMAELEGRIEAYAEKDPYRERVGYLRCFRGIETLTAMTILVELHGVERFTTARQLMSYLGLIPSEYSTGEKNWRGSITKTGNAHVRRVLCEGVPSYRHRPSAGGVLVKRRKGQPAWVIAIADKAQLRLHRRYWKLQEKGKPYGKVIVAMARELVGFLWAVLVKGPAQQVA
jgi:transposase